MATTKTKYRSTFEERTVPDFIKLGGKYETLRIPYAKLRPQSYKPDVVLANGIVIELKGFFTPADRVKMLAVKAANPDLDIRFIFQAPGKFTTKTKCETYAKWAERNGFISAPAAYALSEWPKEGPRVRSMLALSRLGLEL